MDGLISRNRFNPVKQLTLPNGITIKDASEQASRIVYREVFIDEVYFKHGIDLESGDVVVDAGANVGLFSLWLNSLGLNLNIHAFEPVPATYRALAANCSGLSCRFTSVCKALGAKDETITIWDNPRLTQTAGAGNWSSDKENANRNHIRAVVDAHWIGGKFPKWARRWASERMLRWYKKSVPISCETIAWSSYAHQHGIKEVGLFKIDVEGMEQDVLRGIDDADWQTIRQFVVECHDNWGTSCVAKELRKRGYLVIIDDGKDLPMIYARRL